jgi:hypothetical protein
MEALPFYIVLDLALHLVAAQHAGDLLAVDPGETFTGRLSDLFDQPSDVERWHGGRTERGEWCRGRRQRSCRNSSVARDLAHLRTNQKYAEDLKKVIDDFEESPVKTRGGVVGTWRGWVVELVLQGRYCDSSAKGRKSTGKYIHRE